MRKLCIAGLLLVSCGGCFGWSLEKGHLAPFDAAKNPQGPPLQSTPVTPDQVNAQSAHQISQALWDEMDRADMRPTAPTPPALPAKKR